MNTLDPPTVIPGRPYRPSRVSGNPAADGQQRAGLFSTVRDSRLRGNDGREGGRNRTIRSS